MASTHVTACTTWQRRNTGVPSWSWSGWQGLLPSCRCWCLCACATLGRHCVLQPVAPLPLPLPLAPPQSDVKLRDLLRRYGHTTHLVEEFEPPGIVLNRICAAGECVGW